MHAGPLVAVALEISSPRLAILLQRAEWSLAISIRRLTCFRLPVIRVVDDDVAVDVGACAVGVFANKVLVDLSNLLAAVGVGVLVAEPIFELVEVLFVVHFLERFGGDGDGVFEALGQFVFVVLVGDCVEVVQGALDGPGGVQTGELEASKGRLADGSCFSSSIMGSV